MSTNEINIEAVNARQGLQREEKGLTKQQIPNVEQEILKWINAYIPEGKTVQVFKDMLEQYATAEREAGREEERANIPVSFLRQWINEDRKQPHQELVTNEDIMRFINIGYGK